MSCAELGMGWWQGFQRHQEKSRLAVLGARAFNLPSSKPVYPQPEQVKGASGSGGLGFEGISPTSHLQGLGQSLPL